MTPPEAGARRRFAFFLGLVVLVVGLAAWRWQRGLSLDPAAIQALAAEWGRAAPLLYVGAFAIRPFFLFPAVIMFIGGGLAFGAVWGTVYAAIGVTLGGLITFALARALGRDYVEQRLPVRRGRLGRVRWTPSRVCVLNLIPVFPVTAINAGAGLSAMSLGAFTLALVAGSTPRAFAYSFFGSRLVEARTEEVAAAVAMILVLVAVSLLLRRRLHTPKRSIIR